MRSKTIHIIIADTSQIIFDGLYKQFVQAKLNCHVLNAANLQELKLLEQKHPIDLIIINPSLVVNNADSFKRLKAEFGQVAWVALLYAYFEPKMLSMFDAQMHLEDSHQTIISTIEKQLQAAQLIEPQLAHSLTEREVDVLKLLVSGCSNKEIADKLFISTHTVISHRKNISQKTGIKSVSGLTIYAVTQSIISLDGE